MVVISILWMTDVSLKKKAKRLSFFYMDYIQGRNFEKNIGVAQSN